MSFVLSMFVALTSLAVAQEAGHLRAKDAVQAARRASSEDDRQKIYDAITTADIQDDDDLRALHQELKSFHVEKDTKVNSRHLAEIKHLSAVIGASTSPARQLAIKQLLEQEETTIPQNFQGPWGAKSKEEAFDGALRLEALQALATAAGQGHNEQALDSLRRIRKKGGVPGKIAEKAIGQIGKDEDFEAFVNEIKNQPRSLTNLNVFGPRAIKRIVSEVNSPSNTADQKARLIGALPSTVSRDEFSAMLPLLKHQDKRVVRVAATTLGNSLSAQDDAAIRDMLASSNSEIRGAGLVAISRSWDPKFVPDVLNVLKNDSDPWRRSFAAKILGQKHVKDAEGALADVAKNDKAPSVRESADFALKKLRK
jgi:hypothetical protein